MTGPSLICTCTSVLVSAGCQESLVGAVRRQLSILASGDLAAHLEAYWQSAGHQQRSCSARAVSWLVCGSSVGVSGSVQD